MIRGERRRQRRRRLSDVITYETVEQGPAGRRIESKSLNISGAGVCILTGSAHEPGTLLEVCHQYQGAGVSVLRGPFIGRVRWVSPLWKTCISVRGGPGITSSEALVKGSFVLGLEFLPGDLRRSSDRCQAGG